MDAASIHSKPSCGSNKSFSSIPELFVAVDDARDRDNSTDE